MMRGGASRRFVLIALLAMLVAVSVPQIGHTADPARTIDVMAAYLRTLAKLVAWPDGAFAGKESPLVIGVLGDDPFGELLDEAIEGRRGNSRKLSARRLEVVNGELPPKEQLSDCHLLFVSASERDRLPQIFERLRGTNVMTVSDMEDFTSAGGIAQFELVGNNIKIRMNREASQAAGLVPSFRLLRAVTLDGPAQ